MSSAVTIRRAGAYDLAAIRAIYNQGIEDRAATLETDPKSSADMQAWFDDHDERRAILVACEEEKVKGWASLNRFSHRCAHADIADLSVYVARDARGQGLGFRLLTELSKAARTAGFHKIVLHALDENQAGKQLYSKAGFREVGVFREHGRIDGRFVDVVAMEKLLQ